MKEHIGKNLRTLYGFSEEKEVNKQESFSKAEESEELDISNTVSDILEIRKSFDSLLETEQSEEILEKSHQGLVPKKVTITMKDGSTHQAIRWVSADSNLPKKIDHKKYPELTHPDYVDEFISDVINSDETKPIDKQRKLIGSGIYDKNTLDKLSGTTYKDSQYYLKNEAGLNHQDFLGLDLDEQGRLVKGLPTSKSSDYSSKEVVDKLTNPLTGVSKTIHELQEEDETTAFEMQKEMARKLLEELGIDEPTVDDKWDNYETSLRSFIKRGLGSKSLMAYGTGGIGKTYTFMKIAEELELVEYDKERDLSPDEYDFVSITGKIGSNELQRNMFAHSQKMLVFDDCDSMWDDPELINVLKGALDTSNPGKVQFKRGLPETSKGAGDDVPSSFRFTGKMVFITNLTKKKLNKLGAAPIVESRALSMDLSMSPEQTMDRIESILPGIKIKDGTGEAYQGLELSDKQLAFEVFKFVGLKIGRIEQLNTRVFSHILAKAVEQREDQGGYDKKKLTQFAVQLIAGL